MALAGLVTIAIAAPVLALGDTGQQPAEADAGGARPDERGAHPDDIGQQVDQNRISEQLASRFGDRFVGFWIDRNGARSMLTIAITEATGDDAREAKTTTGRPERTTVVAASYTRSTLEGFRDRIETILNEEGLAEYATSIRPATQSVGVEVPALPSTAAERIAAEVPEDAYAITEGVTYELAHSDPNSWSSASYEGGLYVNVDRAGGITSCTTGFKLYSSAYGYFGTTAGHCGGGNGFAARAPLGIYSDMIRANGWHGYSTVTSDSAVMLLPSGTTTGTIHIGSGSHRTVKSQYNSSSPSRGTRVCYFGRTSGSRCGDVNDVDARLTSEGKTVTNLWCATQTWQGGDSGAAAYGINGDGSAAAAGTVHGGKTFTSGDRDVCWTNIADTLRFHGMTLVMG
jgi:streptogrisin B